jgi:hypothetical protein
MEFRLWVGLWTAFFLLLLVAFNLSFLVKYITRFTEDCFATLVAVIFIIDAFKSTLKLRFFRPQVHDLHHDLNTTNNTFSSNITTPEPFENNASSLVLPQISDIDQANQKAVFYFSILLFLMTFVICKGLKSFRDKPFLPTKVSIILFFLY